MSLKYRAIRYKQYEKIKYIYQAKDADFWGGFFRLLYDEARITPHEYVPSDAALFQYGQSRVTQAVWLLRRLTIRMLQHPA